MCSGLRRLTVWCGLLTMTCACDQSRPSTFPSLLSKPAPAAAPTPTPLPVPSPGIPRATIYVGDVIHMTIGPDDPICDPGGWDASAPCKLFLFTPPRNGTLSVTVTATSPSPVPRDAIDLMLFAEPFYTGAPFEYSTGVLSARVIEGRTYVLRINSYPYLLPPPGHLDFELRAEM